MNEKHPKRKKDKYNPYRIYRKDGQAYLKFKDGSGKKHRLAISEELYEAFDRFEREDLSQLNVESRHMEWSDKLEDGLRDAAIYGVESIEETILRKMQREELHNALKRLPEVQRRRLILYYFNDYTYKQIAQIENCALQVVQKSVSAAKKNLKKILEDG